MALSLLVLALLARAGPSGPHLRLEPAAFSAEGRVVTLVAPPPALSASAVAADELPARMLCDLTAVDLDACLATGNGTATCALPVDACLTVDEIAHQGANASLVHAALLARERPHGAAAPATTNSTAATNGTAAWSNTSRAVSTTAVATIGGRGVNGSTSGSGGVSTQAWDPSFTFGCSGAGASTVCSAQASINPCGAVDGLDCSVTAGGSFYPCATPGYVILRAGRLGSASVNWQINLNNVRVAFTVYTVGITEVKSYAVKYLQRIAYAWLVARFLDALPEMSASAVVFAGGSLSAGVLTLDLAVDVELLIASFGWCPFCLSSRDVYFIYTMTGAHFALPFVPPPTRLFSCGSSAALPTTPPTSWTCSGAYYGAGDGCDCACGAIDPDCASPTSVLYRCPGTRAEGWTCSATATPRCVPTTWSCAASYYGTNDGCDCGCGAVDPDCASSSSTLYNCPGTRAAGWSCSANASPQCVPPSWTCSASYFGANDGCDCGCGSVDPDCLSPTSVLYYCPGSRVQRWSCDASTGQCIQAPMPPSPPPPSPPPSPPPPAGQVVRRAVNGFCTDYGDALGNHVGMACATRALQALGGAVQSLYYLELLNATTPGVGGACYACRNSPGAPSGYGSAAGWATYSASVAGSAPVVGTVVDVAKAYGYCNNYVRIDLASSAFGCLAAARARAGASVGVFYYYERITGALECGYCNGAPATYTTSTLYHTYKVTQP
ncbi:hypothetical protein T492DRAFT_857828, partial [Pavlovales sp. CCMP2436]